ncbi:unnamed protein product [Rotaria sp. Silwood2]|nr:unnamed protein product [Rotaria sp. Silwood2]
MASDSFIVIDDTSNSSCASCSSSSWSLAPGSSAAAEITINKTTSNKRKPMLTIHDYYFQMKNYNKAKTIKFWRCANRSCGLLLHTTLNDEFIRFSGNVTEHSHPPNPAELEIRNLRENMRKRAENELVPLQEIAEQEVRRGLLTGEALGVLPNILNLGHNLTRTRRQVMPPIPSSCCFTIPDEYKTDYLNLNRLLLHDSDDLQFQIDTSEYSRPDGRTIVWSSDVQLDLLFASEKLFMDGTFATAPPYFEQLYIIHAIHHDSCIPVVYAALPDRKTTTYLYLFHVLFCKAKKRNKTFEPSLIMTDFEPSATKAISIEV